MYSIKIEGSQFYEKIVNWSIWCPNLQGFGQIAGSANEPRIVQLHFLEQFLIENPNLKK